MKPDVSPDDTEEAGSSQGVTELVTQARPEMVIVGLEYFTDKIGSPDNTGSLEYRIGEKIAPMGDRITVTRLYFGGKEFIPKKDVCDRLDQRIEYWQEEMEKIGEGTSTLRRSAAATVKQELERLRDDLAAGSGDLEG